MKRILFLFFTLLVCSFFNSCKKLFDQPDIQYQYAIPEATNDGLNVSDLTSEGMRKEIIVQLTNQINIDYFKNIHSLVIVKNNKLVYENYFNGYDREMLHNLYSASKSFTSALVGIAIDKGFIPDTNTKILPYFQEYAPFDYDSPEKQNITIRNLLTMTSGIECNDWDPASAGGEEKLYTRKGILRYLLNLPMTDAPGSNPKYCSGGVMLLSNIISKTTGQNYAAFAKSVILEPLGITKYKFNYREKNEQDTPDQIYMRPRDMAKFGMLFLNNGKWNNNQLVSSEWINSSLQPRVKLGNIDYGYLWWSRSVFINGASTRIYWAMGNGGQFIYIIPSLNLVVAITGGNIDSPYTDQGGIILSNYIIPANI